MNRADRRRQARALQLAAVAAVAVGLVVLVLVGLPSLLVPPQPGLEPKDRVAGQNGVRAAGVAALIALGGAATALYTARSYGLNREGQITDRYTKAIDQLGSTALDVRLGGIYALERLMRDSPADQPTIVEVLAAYVREHAPRDPAAASSGPAADVQAALTVLRRRPEHPSEPPVDLGRTCLNGADLYGARLTGATLTGATLTGATLTRADLAGAKLTGADLAGATLAGADLAGAKLTGAKLTGANLTGAKLTGAFLTDAELAGAFLTHANLTGAFLTGANLAGAFLTRANLAGAFLTHANLTGANLTHAFLTHANLTGADLTGEQIEAAIGDGSTVLPKGLQRPSSWR